MNERQQIREAMRNMGGRKPTPIEIELDVVEALKQGVTQKVVAQDMGISQATVSKIKRKYELMERHEEERGMVEKILAGDKENGRLVCTSADVYEGTCRRSNGKMQKKTFRCANLKLAVSQWEKWCGEVRSEDARKAEQHVDAGEKVEDVSRMFPIRKELATEDVLGMLSSVNCDKVTMDATSWACLIAFVRERTSAAQTDGDDATYEDITEFVSDACESDDPLTVLSELRSERDVSVRASEWNRLTELACELARGRVDGIHEELYVTYVPDKGPHAVFSSYEDAVKVTETLNSALEFAGVDTRYDVRDVRPWRG